MNARRVLTCAKQTAFQRWFATKSKSPRTIKWSYFQGCADRPLLGKTIGHMMEETTEKHPTKTAVIFHKTQTMLTFEQLFEQADRLAAGLTALGLKPGDRVGIWAPNCPEWVITQYATARGGFILVTVNPAYQTEEMASAFEKVGMKAIIMTESHKTQKYYEMLKSVCPELENCRPGHLNSARLPDLKAVVITGDNRYKGALQFSEVLNLSSPKLLGQIHDLQDKLNFDDAINIQFTSGTTGSPKGATLSHHNIINNCYFIGLKLGYDQKEARICNPVPLYHCFGMVIGSLQTFTHGATLVYPSPSFEPVATLEAVEKYRCTSIYGTPTMFIDMVCSRNLDSYDFSSVSTGVMAGSPCPIELMKQVTEDLHMPELTICYGTTETSPVSFQTNRTDSLEARVSTIGMPHPHVEAKVVDEQMRLVPFGVTGELCVRGYPVMLNYWNDPQKTKEVIGEDRWYRSGDLCMMDEQGYTKIVGRLKDMIIRGGENIYPVEVENFLYKHPAIEDVQIIGVPDTRLGEQVCAWIKLKQGMTATEQEIKDFCKGQIAHFKVPHYILFVDQYPMTITGKVQKYKMRQAAVEKLGLQKGSSMHHEL